MSVEISGNIYEPVDKVKFLLPMHLVPENEYHS